MSCYICIASVWCTHARTYTHMSVYNEIDCATCTMAFANTCDRLSLTSDWKLGFAKACLQLQTSWTSRYNIIEYARTRMFKLRISYSLENARLAPFSFVPKLIFIKFFIPRKRAYYTRRMQFCQVFLPLSFGLNSDDVMVRVAIWKRFQERDKEENFFVKTPTSSRRLELNSCRTTVQSKKKKKSQKLKLTSINSQSTWTVYVSRWRKVGNNHNVN